MKKQQLTYPFFVIIGPSGSGKTKVTEAVFQKEHKVISHTTRPIRREEKAGEDYFFESEQEFEQLLANGALAEHDEYHGNQYGVGIDTLIQKTSKHYAYDVLTLKGFQAIEQLFGKKVIPIFLDISKENVLARLKKREKDDAVIQERLALYAQEIKNKEILMQYSNCHIIDANQSFGTVVESLKQVIREENQKYLP